MSLRRGLKSLQKRRKKRRFNAAKKKKIPLLFKEVKAYFKGLRPQLTKSLT